MITTLTVILAVAAGQAAEPASAPAAHTPAATAPAARAEPRPAKAAAPEVLPARFQRVQEGAPALRWGEPSRCLVRADTYYRVQCDDATKRCLVAPDAELDPDASPVAQLERAPGCDGPPLTTNDLTSRGYAVVPALAESPPGWYRDERQRAMQVDFDLNARYYLGGGYLFSGGPWSGNAVVAGGGRADRPFTWWNAPALARLHFLEGWASADGNHGELLVFGVDASRVYPTPLLRLTTFFGKPRRFDPPLYFGLWAEGVRMEFLETRGGKTFDRTMFVAGAVTVDVWRSRDLSDFVRLRGGAGYEEAKGGEWSSFVPVGALEGELTLGRGGFHHLRGAAQVEALVKSGDSLAPGLAADRTRLTVKGEYEVILFALNNQPISLALQAKATKRDDVPDYPTGWIGQVGAQLRFSLWAPPRRDARTQQSL
ncbi:MAG TPA: hypothetical protein VLT47_03445 [Anaeromyxobacteraceae bacterium]|nr:hypothetical protein [Anaeromyxobacteraceae bacterium]